MTHDIGDIFEMIDNDLASRGIVIDDEDRDKIFVAGGAVVATFTDSFIKDFDLYFNDQATLDKYVDKATLAGYARTKFSYKHEDSQVTFIHHYVGKAEDIIDRFDFVHCQVFAYLNDELIGRDNLTTLAINKRLLITNKITHPTMSLMRAIKFIRKGWTIEADEWKKICNASSNEPIENVIEYINYPNS